MFVAIINTPGYLPDSDSPTFDTAREAWDYLAEERMSAEDDTEGEDYSPTVDILGALGTEAHWRGDTAEWLADNELDPLGCGTVYGPTPGYDGDHDLGIAYEVQVLEENHVDYPHEPGRLVDCPACEARCHCDDDPGHTACVFDGEHKFGKTDD